jgi:catechol 2,3-dioxygenase-like lactoylglutathione lyase family enzyme
MKIIAIAICLMWSAAIYGQPFQATGKVFVAMNVTDAAATSAWYKDVFGMDLLKELKFEKGRVQIIGNDYLVVELLTLDGSKTLRDVNLSVETSHEMQGYFKFGLYVNNIEAARQYFQEKKVRIEHDVFEDAETKTKSFIMLDFNNNMIQILQAIN